MVPAMVVAQGEDVLVLPVLLSLGKYLSLETLVPQKSLVMNMPLLEISS